MRLLEKDKVVQVEPSQTKDSDYTVRMKNSLDLGSDADDLANRNATALRMTAAPCPRGRVVGETSIEKGAYVGGRPAREYFVRIKC
ncbi:hypothetical protein [Bradyrhizobium sp. 188]|uniref:hypothetical protein n=1 Tax=Bradyrhizobium sp. 188 TaxID=2782656 RepID=UPI001FF7838F|nr:hypothetical protein [Bradyrhizobium sp. 188]MCK1503135.1 hypothetical protein [Bradyrhizobium sp. 188]